MIKSLLTRPVKKRPDRIRLQGRVLYLVDDASMMERQLRGEDLTWSRNLPFRDEISTDEIEKIHINYYLADIYKLSFDLENVFKRADLSIELCEKNNRPDLIPRTKLIKGYTFVYSTRFAEAMAEFKEAARISKDMGQSLLYGELLFRIGGNCVIYGQKKEGMKYMKRSLEILGNIS